MAAGLTRLHPVALARKKGAGRVARQPDELADAQEQAANRAGADAFAANVPPIVRQGGDRAVTRPERRNKAWPFSRRLLIVAVDGVLSPP